VGLINTALVLPLDFLKTRVQKDGSQIPNKSLELINLAKSIYQKDGM